MNRIRKQFATVLCASTILAAPAMDPTVPLLTVDNPAALFPQPDTPTQVTLSEKTPSADGETGYVVRDYTGQETGKGSARREAGKINLQLKLSTGYHELFFPEYSRSVGFAVYPDVPDSSATDGYWCMDSGLTWSRWPHDRKVAIVDRLKSKGISTFRERFSWWKTDDGSVVKEGAETVVRDSVYGEHRILELLQDSPAIYRRGDKKNSFDYDLIQGAAGMRRLEARFGKYWNAFELWNEPFYNDGLPADQYVPTAKMMSAALDTVVAAGSFTPAVAAAYFDTCAESGFLDVIDVFSTHFYSSPESMYESIRYFRDRLKKYDADRLPIWVTESGTPGAVDPKTARPNLKVDSTSAISTAMRGIECLTLGVGRYYPFYLQQHIEGPIAWGMSDFAGTPQRPLAVWLHAAGRIGDKKYLGDLAVSGEVISAHVFGGDDGETVVTVYGKPGARLTLPVTTGFRAYGADGRALTVSGTAPVNTDGLTFLVFEPGRLEGKIRIDTPNMAFYRNPGKIGTRRKPVIIIQPEYPRGQIISHSNNGYTVSEQAAENFKLSARICNLGDSEATVTVGLRGAGVPGMQEKLVIPPRGEKLQTFQLNFRKALTENQPLRLDWTAESTSGNDRAAMLFNRPPSVRTARIAFTATPPTLDALPGSVWETAETVEDTVVRRDIPGDTATPPEEFSSRAKFLWGEAGLYFLVTVKDRRLEPSPDAGNCWMYDSLQLAVSQYNSENDRNRFEWGFYLDNQGKPQKTTFMTSSGKPLSDDCRIAIRRNDAENTTVYEGVIPWSDLGSMNAIYNRTGMKFRLTFCVNDHNGGNRRWSEWSPGISSTKSTELFPEVVLAAGDREELPVAVTGSLLDSANVEMSDRAKFTVQSGNTLKITDKPAGTISFLLPETEMDRPVTLRFQLASTEWGKHNGTGFSFVAGLQDSGSGESYECWLAPSKMYAASTGYALTEKNAPVPILGMPGKLFPPNGLFYTIEMTVDAADRRMTLTVTDAKGERETVVQGFGKRNSMKKFDRIVFRTSGWGSGPFLLKNITVIR